jgi:aspartate carbamoyltransferase catalytic subunit
MQTTAINPLSPVKLWESTSAALQRVPAQRFLPARSNIGATVISYGPKDLQLATGETVQDTARVLANYLDALLVRTNGSIEEMNAMIMENAVSGVRALRALMMAISTTQPR